VAEDVMRPAIQAAAESMVARADFTKVADTPPALAATMLATVAVEAAAPILLGSRFPEMLRLHAKSLAQHQERAERAEAEIEWLRSQARESYTEQARALARWKGQAQDLATALGDALDAAQKGEVPAPDRLEAWLALLGPSAEGDAAVDHQGLAPEPPSRR
jgi:hypothetical protein